MGRILAYVDAVPGPLYPLVPTLLELLRRGHDVTVRCGIDDVGRLRAAGLAAEPFAPEIERFTPDDWRARTPIAALIRGLGQFGERAPAQCRDLRRAIDVESPDAQAEAVGSRLLRPGNEDRGDHADLAVDGASGGPGRP